MRFMFIGGYPKGYDNSFAPETRSGFIPRNIGKELKIDALYFDIWKNAKEENDGVVSRDTCEHLKSQQDECIEVVSGKRVQTASSHMDVKFVSAPHPAARRPEQFKS